MKILGIKEVNQRLPLIKPITLDIQRMWSVIMEQKEKSEKMEDGDAKDQLLKELKNNIDKINGYIKEVEQLDGLMASFNSGEVHFTSLYHGRKIFLCVLPLEEENVQYFHELDETFADRIQIDNHVLQTCKEYEKK